MKKLLVGATLSIAVAAVIKRVTRKKPARINLNLGSENYRSFASTVTKEYTDPSKEKDIQDFIIAVRSNISNFKDLTEDAVNKSESLDESLNELAKFARKLTK